jgi:murein DD-endopeptidase MepM/ murein hydrolase activator NlpD
MRKFFSKFNESFQSFLRGHISFYISFNTPGKSLSLHVSHRAILIAFSGLALFFVSIFLFWGGYAQKATTKAYLQYLEFNNDRNDNKLTQLTSQIEDLKTYLSGLLAFDGELCQLYDISQLDPDTRQVGTGGELIGADADLMRDQRISDLSTTYQQILLEYDQQSDILSSAKGQERIWAFTPTIKPVAGPIISGFCWRRNPLGGGIQFHTGIDIAMPQGAPIVATADGTVSFAGAQTGYGLVVFIDHKYGFQTRYGHCSQLLVKEGDEVKRGDLIALVGTTGWSTGPHTHYEVLVNGVHIDPMRYILPEYIED